jgi:hypothetical protein
MAAGRREAHRARSDQELIGDVLVRYATGIDT